jgi:hypothetical protein
MTLKNARLIRRVGMMLEGLSIFWLLMVRAGKIRPHQIDFDPLLPAWIGFALGVALWFFGVRAMATARGRELEP